MWVKSAAADAASPGKRPWVSRLGHRKGVGKTEMCLLYQNCGLLLAKGEKWLLVRAANL